MGTPIREILIFGRYYWLDDLIDRYDEIEVDEINESNKFIVPFSLDIVCLHGPKHVTPDQHMKLLQLRHESEKAQHVHWALLLSPAGDNTYTRIGMGLFYPPALENDGVVHTDFRIV